MRTRKRGNCSQFEIVQNITGKPLVIRDIGRHCVSVTNDAENVVAELRAGNMLPEGRRLFYYDSTGHFDEILLNARGFAGFGPGREAHYAG